MNNLSILIVEDEAIVAEDIACKVRKLGYDVAGVTETGEEAIELARRHRPALVLMDIRLAGIMDGITAAQMIQHELHLPILFLTAHSDAGTVEQAIHAGTLGYLLKPFDEHDLRIQVEMALYKHTAEQQLRESEERYRLLVESANSVIIRWKSDGILTFVNEYAQTFFGYAEEEIVGRNVGILVPQRDSRRPELSKMLRDIVNNPERYKNNENENICRDGHRVWMSWTNKPIRDQNGRVIEILSIGNDVTPRKQMEEVLYASKAKLESALASMTDAVFISDIEGQFVDFNDAFATFHKFRDKNECLKTLAEYPAFLDVFSANGELVPLEQWAVPRALRGETATNTEYTLRRKDTGETWVGSYSFAPIRNQNGTIIGSVVVGRDITSSKEEELAKLHRVKDRYRAIVMDQYDLICRFDPQGRITFVNDAYCRCFGVNHQEILGTNFLPHIYQDDLPLVRDHFINLTRQNPQKTIEHRVCLADQSIRWQQWSGRALFDDKGKIFEYQAVGRDITRLKEAEEKLQNELRFRQLFLDALPCIALLIEHHTYRIVAANKAAVAAFALPGGKCYATWMQRDSPCPWCLAPTVAKIDESQNDQFWDKGIYRDVYWVPVDENLYLHYSFDITAEEKIREALEKVHDELEQRVMERTLELQKSHAQLLHAEKLGAIGNLSASIAHEFNNPLQSVMTILKGVRQYASLEQQEEVLVDLALQECGRMKTLIADLRDFHRPSSGQLALMDLHATLDSLLLLCKKDFKNRKITTKKKYADKLPSITAVADQLKQVFLNLLTNAADACEGGGGITITTETTGKDVIVHIEDNGSGISPKNMGHIFEPFFTTKPELKGTGLGLSVSYGIIKKHGGHIDVKSELGKGAKFSVILPIESINNEQ